MAPKVQEEGGEQKGQITTLTSSVGGVELVPLAFVAERGKERSQKGKSHFKELLPAEKLSSEQPEIVISSRQFSLRTSYLHNLT